MPYFEDDNLWAVVLSEKKRKAGRERWSSLEAGVAIPGIANRGDQQKRFPHRVRIEGQNVPH